MRLPAPSINLLRDQEKSFFEKLISWSLNIGRLILILTECLALGVFLYRFKLDRDIVDLHDEIEKQQTFVRLLESREKEYRNIEQRLTTAGELLSSTPQATTITKQILDQADNALLVNQFALSPTSFHIEGRAISLDKVRVFIEYLKTYPNVEGVSVDRIENKTSTASLEVSISADFKKGEKKKNGR